MWFLSGCGQLYIDLGLRVWGAGLMSRIYVLTGLIYRVSTGLATSFDQGVRGCMHACMCACVCVHLYVHYIHMSYMYVTLQCIPNT